MCPSLRGRQLCWYEITPQLPPPPWLPWSTSLVIYMSVGSSFQGLLPGIQLRQGEAPPGRVSSPCCHHHTGGKQGQGLGRALPELSLMLQSLPSAPGAQGCPPEGCPLTFPPLLFVWTRLGPAAFFLLRITPSPGPYGAFQPTVWDMVSARTPSSRLWGSMFLLSLVTGFPIAKPFLKLFSLPRFLPPFLSILMY